MSMANIERYRQALEAQQAELAAGHRHADAIAVERVADSMDQVILANERDLALGAWTREAFLSRQVSAALERLAAGTFGLPWAALCLRCQETTDNADGTEAGLSWPLPAAA